MVALEPSRRLIVTADDFGRSASINQAIERAHQQGILTCASLLVAGEAFDEAVRIARANPRLGVGLHLTLLRGQSCLPKTAVPDLVDAQQQFSRNPVRTGFRYFFRRRLHPQVAAEVAAQFERFQATGLPLDHVNGHLNIHLHPTVVRAWMPRLAGRPAAGFRLTRDPFWLNSRVASGRWAYRIGHAGIFACLAAWTHPRVRRAKLPHTRAVFGLLQTGQVDEQFLLRLLARLPQGDCELYSHPSVDESPHELDALVSRRVSDLVRQQNISLIRYTDL